MAAVRRIEAQGAAAYWSVWHDLPICFPKSDVPRVPDHWRAFDTRKSLLTGSQRLATNPVNAILNYLYAVLESEARLGAAASSGSVALGRLPDSRRLDRLPKAPDRRGPVPPVGPRSV